MKGYHVVILGRNGEMTDDYLLCGKSANNAKDTFNYLEANIIAHRANRRRKAYYDPGYKTIVVVPAEIMNIYIIACSDESAQCDTIVSMVVSAKNKNDAAKLAEKNYLCGYDDEKRKWTTRYVGTYNKDISEVIDTTYMPG